MQTSHTNRGSRGIHKGEGPSKLILKWGFFPVLVKTSTPLITKDRRIQCWFAPHLLPRIIVQPMVRGSLHMFSSPTKIRNRANLDWAPLSRGTTAATVHSLPKQHALTCSVPCWIACILFYRAYCLLFYNTFGLCFFLEDFYPSLANCADFSKTILQTWQLSSAEYAYFLSGERGLSCCQRSPPRTKGLSMVKSNSTLLLSSNICR